MEGAVSAERGVNPAIERKFAPLTTKERALASKNRTLEIASYVGIAALIAIGAAFAYATYPMASSASFQMNVLAQITLATIPIGPSLCATWRFSRSCRGKWKAIQGEIDACNTPETKAQYVSDSLAASARGMAKRAPVLEIPTPEANIPRALLMLEAAWFHHLARNPTREGDFWSEAGIQFERRDDQVPTVVCKGTQDNILNMDIETLAREVYDI